MRTITREIDALIESGLITLDVEVEFISTGKEKIVKVYHFPVDKENNPFKIIDKKILKYLVDTSNGQCIRVYLYLLNKYLWKQDLDQDYIFTIQEIKEALGYSTTTKAADETIKNILACFKSQGVIRYEFVREMQNIEETRLVPVQRMALKYDPAKLPDLNSL